MRTTSEVIEDHLRRRSEGDLDRDLTANYANEVVLLSYEGVHRGHDGVRKLAGILDSYVRAAGYNYDDVVVEGDYALLRWSAEGDGVVVHDGVDSFVIRDGRIVVQTIHYSTSPAQPTA
jgi:SnoaL-like domain